MSLVTKNKLKLNLDFVSIIKKIIMKSNDLNKSYTIDHPKIKYTQSSHIK